MEEDNAEQTKGRAARCARLVRYRAGATTERRTAADDDVTPGAAPDRGRRLPSDVGLPCEISGDSDWRLPVDPCHTPHGFRRAGQAHAMTKLFSSQVSDRSAYARLPQSARTDTRARSPHPASAHPRPPAVAGPPILEPRVVSGQQVQSPCHRFVSRAKMRALAGIRGWGFNATNGGDHHNSCHSYALWRPSRTAAATDPLTAEFPPTPPAWFPIQASQNKGEGCQMMATLEPSIYPSGDLLAHRQAHRITPSFLHNASSHRNTLVRSLDSRDKCLRSAAN